MKRNQIEIMELKSTIISENSLEGFKRFEKAKKEWANFTIGQLGFPSQKK